MENKHDYLFWGCLAVSSLILALEPVGWVLTSWRDPTYQSYGALYCAVLAGLILLSLRHPPKAVHLSVRRVFPLFMLAAAIRLAGQVLAINVLSALALSIDVFALALLLRLDQRRLALSPFWLAVFFLFALPLAPILQRVAGFPLQMVSADIACVMLSGFFTELVCEGVRLKINGHDVLVDLPCSGASGLLLMVSLWTFLNILYRPPLGRALIGGLAVAVAAVVGNGLRISLLAAGLAVDINTMAPTLHEAIGLFTTAAVALPVLAFYRPSPAGNRPVRPAPRALPRGLRVPAMGIALGSAILIVSLPHAPVDRSAPVAPVALPQQVLGFRARSEELTGPERLYFTTYGGTAQKMRYGPLGLNVVRTGSPLRHLHSPATCLLGMGYQVRFLGTRYDPLPSSIYEATAPDGMVWTVAVSFVSDKGDRTASVGEAVWRWLNGGARQWQSVQRITPQSLPDPDRIAFENAALAALDL